MPRIPLADIPNAPSLGPGPIATVVPQANADLSGAARSLMTPTMDLGAISAEAKGLQGMAQGLAHFGESGQRAADVLHDWKKTKEKARDAISAAQIDNARADFLSGLAEQNKTLPPDQWLANFDKAYPKLEKSLSTHALSASGAARLATEQLRWAGQARTRLSTQSTIQGFEQGKSQIIASFRRNVAEGNFEQGHAILAQGRGALLLSDHEYEGLTHEGNETARENGLYATMSLDPRAFLQETKELLDTGKSAVLDDSIRTPEEAQIWYLRAQKKWQLLQSTERKNLFGGIYDRMITRADQLDAALSPYLDEKDAVAARAALANQEAILDPEKYLAMRVEVASYHEASDPDGAKRASLERGIAFSLPADQARMLSGHLHGMSGDKSEFQEVDSLAKSNIGQLHELGFGKGWMNGSRFSEGDPQRQAAVEMNRLMSRWEAHHQKNPNLTNADAMKWIQDQIKPQREAMRAMGFGSRTLVFSGGTAPHHRPTTPPSINPENALRQMDSFTQKPSSL